jgi:CoA-transferase family III
VKRLLDAVADGLARLARAGGPRSLQPKSLLYRAPLDGFGEPGLWSTNRSCRLVPARDGWLAVTLARDEDRDAVPALTGSALDADPWVAIIAHTMRQSAQDILAQAMALHLPVAIVGEANPATGQALADAAQRTGMAKVLDLSALWAGPLCGGLLAKAGLEVTRIESPSRPDPTAHSSPALDAWLNGAKVRRSMALDDLHLLDLIAGTDILVTSGRPHALARKGLSEEALFALNPGLIWVAITAHGWRGDAALRVGFGDDAAAAGGLLAGTPERPHFMGDALADPLTGLEAATHALEALAAGKCGLIDVALAPTAALYAQRMGLR